ncbi:M23 family metallopeptidase [Microbacterium sp. nov. GSS16]|uniref:M23 family metallopeptidase n=1 Tax=Microbacterium sp. nov. GSS16 TaxID=3019890 RepID=UPI0023066139|nr:M23 family metallopeptidase [Microbacterium sp. nov. GSS16]WCD92934.1 M23 family metallopeptidase [Microbacterium sp. nov. GSS16]
MVPADSTTPNADQVVPTSASAVAAAAAVTAAAVSAAATSRRARRMAASAGPEAPTVAEPEAVIAPAAVIAEIVASVASAAQPAPAPAVRDEPSAVEIEQIAEQVAAAAEPEAAPVDADAFAAASMAFGFRPVDDQPRVDGSVDDVPVADEPVSAGVVASHLAPRRPRVSRFVAAGASLGIMGVAGLIAVSMTLPVSAVAAAQGGASASLVAGATAAASSDKVDEGEIQAFVAPADVQGESLARSDSYSTISLAQVAAEEGIKFSESLYTNDPEAAIQWPFKVGVAMSSPYGQRWGRLHAGIDLVPGEGAPIQAIADGTVRIATESGGAYGVTIYIDHVIDGQVVTSHYAHMQHGSMQVKAGDKVKVGDVIGHVGNTGRSYGAHLHFEIIINGSTVDPLPWMQRNAGRYEY